MNDWLIAVFVLVVLCLFWFLWTRKPHDPAKRCNDIIKKFLDEKMPLSPGMEVSGTITDSEIDKNGNRIIHGINLIEISIVDDPPNPHCVIDQAETDRRIAAMRHSMKRVGDELAAHEVVYLLLGYEFQGEGQTLRVRLGGRIRTGEFYPFDSDAEQRLMKAITEDCEHKWRKYPAQNPRTGIVVEWITMCEKCNARKDGYSHTPGMED